MAAGRAAGLMYTCQARVHVTCILVAEWLRHAIHGRAAGLINTCHVHVTCILLTSNGVAQVVELLV